MERVASPSFIARLALAASLFGSLFGFSAAAQTSQAGYIRVGYGAGGSLSSKPG